MLSCVLLGLTLNLDAQSNLRNQILQGISSEAQGLSSELHRPFTLIKESQRGLSGLKVTDQALLLTTDQKLHENLQKGEPAFQLEMPINSSETVLINLTKVSVMADDGQVVLATDTENAIAVDAGLHYWGKVVGDPNSLVTINVYDGEMSGVISFDDQTLTLTKLVGQDEMHTIYSESELDLEHSIGCMTDDVKHFMGDLEQDHNHGRSAGDANNCVRVYLEVANDVYKDKGGTQGTTNYMTGLFNQVIALYAAENVNMAIGKMKLWDTNDPYTGNASSQMNKLKTRLKGNFDGDIAHLVSYGNGGIAYVDVLRCDLRQYAVGYSGIGKTYKNAPSFSWSVNVLAHEIGHNLGSQHTHACVWNGNNTQIDDCGSVYGAVEGSCYNANQKKLPSSGTIMSYCHVVQGVGIKFANGFGTQPGNLIRDRVHNSDCLASCGGSGPADAPLSLAVAKTNVNCGETADGTATANPTGGSGTYTYSWSNGSKTRKIAGLIAGTYSVTVSDGSHAVEKEVEVGIINPNQCSSTCQRDILAPAGQIVSNKGVSTFTQLGVPVGTKDVKFRLYWMESTSRYIEEVRVSYVDASGRRHLHGVYRGDVAHNAFVTIPRIVRSVRISLRNVGRAMGSGKLTIRYTAPRGCISTGNLTGSPLVNNTPSVLGDGNEIVETQQNLSAQIYPNPASEQFNIEMSQVAESGMLYMFDGLGSMVLNQSFEQSDRLPVDVGQLPRGTYFVRLETKSSEPITKRIVIN